MFSLLRKFAKPSQTIRYYSKSNSIIGNRCYVEKIALTDDGKMFVAWHPKAEFPYEHTLPVPTVKEQNRSAVLKNSAIETAMKAFHSKKPELARRQLAGITFTSVHPWFPRARDKKAKKTPMDREYL